MYVDNMEDGEFMKSTDTMFLSADFRKTFGISAPNTNVAKDKIKNKLKATKPKLTMTKQSSEEISLNKESIADKIKANMFTKG